MIHIMMDINKHQDQYTWGDNVGRDLYLLGVNVLVTWCSGIRNQEIGTKIAFRPSGVPSLNSFRVGTWY